MSAPTVFLSAAQMLPPAEREVWLKLGVFTTSFDARAAEAIAGADETMLGHFVSRSLLEREGSDRYKLHNLAADYARAQLGEAALADLHLAHARHYTVISKEADTLYCNGDFVSGLALFDRERAQIEAAYAALARSADTLSASALDDEKQGRQVAGVPSQEAATALIALVDAVTYTSDQRFHPHQRIAWLEGQLCAARLVNDKHNEGNALGNLGTAYRDLDNAPEAIEYFEQALAVNRQIGNKRGEGATLGNIGNVHTDMGDAPTAIEYHEQALVIMRKVNDQDMEIITLGNLGHAHLGLGETCKAIEYHEKALVIAREIGDPLWESLMLGNIGSAYLRIDNAPKAIESYEKQLAIIHTITDRRGEGTALWNSALAYDILGNRTEAIARAEGSLRTREATESRFAANVRATLTRWKSSAEL